jgi:hypothetical protein
VIPNQDQAGKPRYNELELELPERRLIQSSVVDTD